MDDVRIARLYAEAANMLQETQAAQSRLVLENVDAYDRYFDLAVRVSPERARELMPDEAAIVERIESGILAVNEARGKRWDALTACLLEKMEAVAKQPADRSRGDAQMMADALRDVGRFRIEHLDGIDGRFDALAALGVGFQPKEKDRLLNRMVAAWARARGVTLKDLKPEVEEWRRAARCEDDPSGAIPFR